MCRVVVGRSCDQLHTRGSRRLVKLSPRGPDPLWPRPCKHADHHSQLRPGTHHAPACRVESCGGRKRLRDLSAARAMPSLIDSDSTAVRARNQRRWSVRVSQCLSRETFDWTTCACLALVDRENSFEYRNRPRPWLRALVPAATDASTWSLRSARFLLRPFHVDCWVVQRSVVDRWRDRRGNRDSSRRGGPTRDVHSQSCRKCGLMRARKTAGWDRLSRVQVAARVFLRWLGNRRSREPQRSRPHRSRLWRGEKRANRVRETRSFLPWLTRRYRARFC